jgi:hypothetical protein
MRMTADEIQVLATSEVSHHEAARPPQMQPGPCSRPFNTPGGKQRDNRKDHPPKHGGSGIFYDPGLTL